MVNINKYVILILIVILKNKTQLKAAIKYLCIEKFDTMEHLGRFTSKIRKELLLMEL